MAKEEKELTGRDASLANLVPGRKKGSRNKTTLFKEAMKGHFEDLLLKDGEKVFGRWNANGPGTAKLFADLGCGVNFTSFESARPGDFLKLWWTEAIGGKERGHLVVYLGHNDQEVTFWSANEPGGYGRKSVRRTQIKHHLFSRLTRPSRLPRVTRLSSSDPFLADMLRRDFTWSQVVRECRVSNTP